MKNKQYVIDIEPTDNPMAPWGAGWFVRVRRRGNNARIFTSEVYVERRKAEQMAEAFVTSISRCPNVEIANSHK